jgi:hypothetical protein
LADREPKSPVPAFPPPGRSLTLEPAGFLRPKPKVPPDRPGTCVPDLPGSQLPSRSPVLPDDPLEPKLPAFAGGGALSEDRPSAGQVSRRAEPGVRGSGSGVLEGRSLDQVSPRAPRQGRSPGGSPLGRAGFDSLFLSPRCRNRSSGSLEAGSLAEALVLPGSPWTEILGPAGSQLPSRSPVLPDDAVNRSPGFAGGDAPTCVPLSPDRSWTEVRCPA